ncbi:MAG: glycosyltransferase [Thermoplasmataceae archaeon]
MHIFFFVLYLVLGSLTLTTFIYYVVNSFFSRRYSTSNVRNDLGPDDVTIVIPVYNEEEEIFKECIDSVSAQGSKFIVVGDSSYEPYRTIVEAKGGVFIHKPVREGQKKAIVTGLQYVETPYVLLMDSDTILPENAVRSMVSHFVDGVGGVGPNISIKNTGTAVSYGSEFVERSREVIFRAMSAHGSVMHLDGACVMYRTDVVKPFILSGEFADFKIMGKPTLLGEDWLLALHTLNSGLELVKDYSVTVKCYPQRNFKKFVKQSIRWSRSEWIRFGMDLKSGNAIKRGKFYTFELVYTYMLPLIAVSVLALRAYQFFAFTSNDIAFFDLFHDFLSLFIARTWFFTMVRVGMYLVNFFGTGVFLVTVAGRIHSDRLRTLAYGGLAMGTLFLTTLYGLLTFWKRTGWMTR